MTQVYTALFVALHPIIQHSNSKKPQEHKIRV
ncbi:photosystem I reaction center subunit XII [Salmonella enterica]|nr:hypothetical protein [Salmonella enterica]EBG0320491.1 photosystem I reaction center subunit XII [Salmonella enterica subsp. enterica serovar Infantis]EBU9429438.1 hypothetical protein [Salmonella enterica subsp. enterica serovar Braenderup]ECH9065349.1 photosystem I reaction center subunit XII [Salmonella enterica subsp. enterica]EDC8049116.1 photosystem I reaction center subunit XII [Salmonella enterica subsp. enterica serovar Muenchen]EDQ0830445.1 photosystem I reaction center subunit XI